MNVKVSTSLHFVVYFSLSVLHRFLYATDHSAPVMLLWTTPVAISSSPSNQVISNDHMKGQENKNQCASMNQHFATLNLPTKVNFLTNKDKLLSIGTKVNLTCNTTPKLHIILYRGSPLGLMLWYLWPVKSSSIHESVSRKDAKDKQLQAPQKSCITVMHWKLEESSLLCCYWDCWAWHHKLLFDSDS